MNYSHNRDDMVLNPVHKTIAVYKSLSYFLLTYFWDNSSYQRLLWNIARDDQDLRNDCPSIKLRISFDILGYRLKIFRCFR